MRILLLLLSCALAVGCSPDAEPEPEALSDAQAEAQAEAMTGAAPALAPPDADARSYPITTHGDERIDEYYWLRDDERRDPDVLSYLEAENGYLEQVLEPASGLRETLFEEMVGRLKRDESSVPVKDGPYWYLRRYEESGEYPIIARRRGGPEGEEAVLLDANERAAGSDYYALGATSTSDDHRYLAIAEDTVSRRLYTLRIKDLEADEFLPDVIENTSGDMAWSADGQWLFYVRRDLETLLPYAVYRHRLGTPVSEDVLVYEEADPTFYTSLYRGGSGDWIYLHLGQTISDEVRLVSASDPTSAPLVFLPRERSHEYSVTDVNGRFFVLTNRDAENFRLLETSLESRDDSASWREVIAHRSDAFLHDVDAFEGFLAVEERVEGLRRVRLLALDEGEDVTLPVDEAASTVYLDDNREVSSTVVRFSATSLTTPKTVYEFDRSTGERRLLKRDPVLGDFDRARYASERFMIEARDGTAVPVSLVYRKPFESDGTRPLLVYGYGSYGSSRDPAFSSARLSLLDRGFVYAIAHVRGGQELGRQWYEQGRMFNKINTFHDFIDVTRALVERGYGDPARVYAYGGSAGGLLMGAVANMAPELYHGMVAAVPFVDVVTTMLDESIPLTTGEFDEWGNPKIQDQYDYMLSYSPYDQVTAQAYPHLLVTTGLHDSQVQYWEPAKWVARLRDRKTDDNYLLLQTDMSAGHSGASGRYRGYEDTALRYGFLVWLAEGGAQ